MDVKLSEQAANDLDEMDNPAYLLFLKHLEKIAGMPPRRHLRFGVPVHVEDVGQGRILYQVTGEALLILRCFTSHKDYEKWFKSFK